MKTSIVIVMAISVLCICVPIRVINASEIQEPPPDSTQTISATQSYYHLYGTWPGEFDIGNSYPEFDNVFNLFVSESVAQWDSAMVAEFIVKVLDGDSTNTDDVFPVIWNYFCYKDADPYYESIDMTIWYQNYTDINIRLYDINDFLCPGPFECSGWSWYTRGTNFITLCTNNLSIEYLVKATFAHELQHLCFEANGITYKYNNINETLSMAAMHLVRSYELFIKEYDISYDSSIFRDEQCDPDEKYYIEEMWIGYLLDVFINESNYHVQTSKNNPSQCNGLKFSPNPNWPL